MTRWRSLFSNPLPFLTLSLQHLTKNASTLFDTSLEALCWSPDGQVLLVAFENGNFYYLNAQNGKPVFFIDFDRTPSLIHWFEIEPADQFNIGNQLPVNVKSFLLLFVFLVLVNV